MEKKVFGFFVLLTVGIAGLTITGCGKTVNEGDTYYSCGSNCSQQAEPVLVVSEEPLSQKSTAYMPYSSDYPYYGVDGEVMSAMAGSFEDSMGEHENNTDYTSIIVFSANHSYGESKDYIGPMVRFPGGSQKAYEWQVNLDEPVAYSLDDPWEDLIGSRINLASHGYYTCSIITNVSVSAVNELSTLVLMRSTNGFNPEWLKEDVPYRFYDQGSCQYNNYNKCQGDYTEVKVVDASEDEKMCSVSINGNAIWLEKGQMQEVSGVPVGVVDVAIDSASGMDYCELILHAEEVQFSSMGQGIKVNGAKVDYTSSKISSWADYLGNTGYLYSFGYEMAGEAIKENVNALLPGATYIDPVQGFMFQYTPQNTEMEHINLSAGNDGNAILTFSNESCTESSIALAADGSAVAVVSMPPVPPSGFYTTCNRGMLQIVQFSNEMVIQFFDSDGVVMGCALVVNAEGNVRIMSVFWGSPSFGPLWEGDVFHAASFYGTEMVADLGSSSIASIHHPAWRFYGKLDLLLFSPLPLSQPKDKGGSRGGGVGKNEGAASIE